MAGSNRGGRSSASADALARQAFGVLQKLQTAGPRALARTLLVCGFLASWKAAGALLAGLVFLLGWWLVHSLVWAYGVPRWLPYWGRRHRGRRGLLAEHGRQCPSFPALLQLRRAENRRFARLRRQWAVLSDANPKLLGVGSEVIPLERMRSTVDGDVQAYIRCGVRGVPPAQFVKHTEEVRAAIGCKGGFTVRYVGVDEAEVTFMWTEPLARHLDVEDVPKAPKGTLAYGVLGNGLAAAVVLGLPLLVTGMTGSGKSSVVWGLFNDIDRQELRTQVWCSDAKGGVEMGAFRDKVSTPERPQRLGPRGHLEVMGYATNVEETGDLIRDFYDAMKARLAAQTFRKWTPEMAWQFPLLLLVIDETVEVVKLSPKPVRDLLLTIISQIRAAGGMVIAGTQMAQKDVLGDIRDMFPQRISLAQRNAINTNMALGDGAEAEGATCSLLTLPADAGRGFAYSDTERGFKPFKAGWCSDENVEQRISRGLAVTRQEVVPADEERVAVYRLYNELGELLYVGISNKPGARWKQHADPNSGSDFKPWWGEVCMTGQHKPLVVWCTGPSARADAEAAETAACETELPRYNDRKNPDTNPLKVRWRDRRRTAPEAEEEVLAELELQFDGPGSDPQPALDAPEPIELPEPETPAVEVPEQTQPQPETPEPRHEPVEVPERTAPEPETRELAGATQGRTRRPRTPTTPRTRRS